MNQGEMATDWGGKEMGKAEAQGNLSACGHAQAGALGIFRKRNPNADGAKPCVGADMPPLQGLVRGNLPPPRALPWAKVWRPIGALNRVSCAVEAVTAVAWIEMAMLGLLLVAVNGSLFVGGVPVGWMFFPEAVAAGEWWRVILHPLAHVSLYHLFLDSAAFFLIYRELGFLRRPGRIGLLLGTGGGALWATILFWEPIATHGLCGLSGVVHGLAAFWAARLGWAGRGRLERVIGAAVVFGLIAKCAGELFLGTEWSGALHLGAVGIPVAASHAGGAAAGLVFAFVYLAATASAQRMPSRAALTMPPAKPAPSPQG
jgi:membrane associated rhomboid family serine protease